MITIDCEELSKDNFELLSTIRGILFSISYDGRDEKQYTPLLFAHSVLGMAKSCNILIENKDVDYINILLRSMLEALAKLSMLTQDMSKIGMLKRSSDEGLLSMLPRFVEGNEESSFDKELQASMQTVVEHRDDLERYVKEESRITWIIDNYLKKEYLAFYKRFCFDAHSDVFILNAVHTFEQNDPELCSIVLIMLHIVVDALGYLLVFFPVVSTQDFDKLKRTVEDIRNKHFAHVSE